MSQLQLSCFQTELGWFGLVGRESILTRLCFGQCSLIDLLERLRSEFDEDWEESDWQPKLRSRLERFAGGHAVGFDDFELDLSWCTDFQSQVIQRTRAILFGETMSYGALAAACGRPNAARAVGTVMSSNRYPIIVPCHRVLGSGGKLGGFSAPGGTNVKRHLLEMESPHETLLKPASSNSRAGAF